MSDKIDTEKIIGSFFENKQPVLRYFIITFGPTGSGKSGIVDKITTKLGIKKNSLINILVDDIVQKIPGFENEYSTVMKSKVDEDTKEKQRDEIYFRYRKLYADSMSENILNLSMVNHYNIVFETTGYSIAWTIRTIQIARQNGYFIILVYPYVDTNTLIKRLENREKKEKEEKGYARIVNKTKLSKNIESITNNFEKLANFVDSFYIYDNAKDYDLIYEIIEYHKIYQGYCKKNEESCDNNTGIIQKTKCVNKEKLMDAKLPENLKGFVESKCSYLQ